MNSMKRSSFFHAAAGAAAVLFALANVAHARVIGGWTASRGGPSSGILTGGEGTVLRQEVAAHFAGTTLAESSYLSSTFLSSIDMLYISAVYNGFDMVAPLDSTEQANVAAWVSNGGRALFVTDNPAFAPTGNSMVNPFGLSISGSGGDGAQLGTITDHTSWPMLTDGPFGTVTTFDGGYIGSYNPGVPASVAVLGTWNLHGLPGLAATNYGNGSVVFYGDESMMGDTTLLDNVLAFTLVPEPSAMGFLISAGVLGILLAPRRRCLQGRWL